MPKNRKRKQTAKPIQSSSPPKLPSPASSPRKALAEEPQIGLLIQQTEASDSPICEQPEQHINVLSVVSLVCDGVVEEVDMDNGGNGLQVIWLMRGLAKHCLALVKKCLCKI